jgi:hypothetical protein
MENTLEDFANEITNHDDMLFLNDVIYDTDVFKHKHHHLLAVLKYVEANQAPARIYSFAVVSLHFWLLCFGEK